MKSDHSEFVLSGSPLLHHVVSNHLLYEAYLRRELRTRLVKPDVLITEQSPSFSNLVNICEASGVIDSDQAQIFRTVNSIRNKYAHRLGFEAAKEQVEQLLTQLRQMDHPFYMSYVPGSEHELAKALAALAGFLQHKYGSLET
jgi:hypothetical protein